MSIRRFGIGFKLHGSPARKDYELPINSDSGHTAKDAVSALHEFHKHMQRTQGKQAGDYTVCEVYSHHNDIRSQEVRMNYDLPGGDNPDVSEVRRKKQDAPSTLFDDANIRQESQYARARMAR